MFSDLKNRPISRLIKTSSKKLFLNLTLTSQLNEKVSLINCSISFRSCGCKSSCEKGNKKVKVHRFEFLSKALRIILKTVFIVKLFVEFL